MEEFQNEYENVGFISLESVEEKNGHYEVIFKREDYNEAPDRYREEMVVENDRILVSLSEKFLSDVVRFGDLSAYAAERDGISYIFLVKNEQETIIDEIDNNNKEYYRTFRDVKLSPGGNYLYYNDNKGSIVRIYSIKDSRILDKYFAFPNYIEFSEDEQYLVACACSAYSGEYYGKIMSMPDFREVYDVASDVMNEPLLFGAIELECGIDNEREVVKYTFSCFPPEYDCEKNDEKTIEYKW
ncbi:MAG: hypothetical protein EOM19_08340 [Candidatus Moranbacteria bacterium]|nr:hypothetical protein [Candidatus Moranbacteria bacterium]